MSLLRNIDDFMKKKGGMRKQKIIIEKYPSQKVCPLNPRHIIYKQPKAYQSNYQCRKCEILIHIITRMK